MQTQISNQNELEYSGEENDLENRSNQSYRAFDTGSNFSDQKLTTALFEDFKNTVFASRPNIANMYSTIGDMPFYTYARSHVRENRNKIIKSRKSQLTAVIHEHVRKRLGSLIADSVVKQLKTNDSVSTVQHFSPIGHPDSLNAVLENALPYFGMNNPSFQNVLVFACASVSFNNTKYPRGHLFHTNMNGEIHTNQLNFFGHTVDAQPVVHHSAYTPIMLKETRNAILKLEQEKKIQKETRLRILELLDTLYAAPHPMSCDEYIDQLTVANYHFFKELFANYNKYVPSLIYLSQEKVVLDLLLAHHLDQATTIHRMLFDPKVHQLIEEHFEGVTGAFSKEKGLGSFLFWGMPQGGKYRIQLWRQGNTLVAADGSYRVELTPESIRQAILNNELIPSVMLTFSVLALYYGLFLGGGYEQTYYLTQTKLKYREVLEKIGDKESIAACEDVITTNLVIPRPLLLYLAADGEKRVPATGLDMLLYGNGGNSWNRILEASKRVTVGELIERTLPSIYREYSKDQSNKSFSIITERDIEQLNRLDEKIPTLATL